MSATKSIVSIGELADRNRVSLAKVEAVLRRLRIAPALRIDSIPYFDEADVLQIEQALEPLRGPQASSSR